VVNCFLGLKDHNRAEDEIMKEDDPDDEEDERPKQPDK
jgi:hypothetical protein